MISAKQTIQRLNERYAEVTAYKRIKIFDGDIFLSVAEFRQRLAGYNCMNKDKVIPQSTVWLNSTERMVYDGVCFEPGKTPAHLLNLYKGLAFAPKAGPWNLFQEHIFRNVCKGRKDHYNWLLDWMGQIVQEPDTKMGTAVVIRGLKGTGKSLYAETFGKLFGTYFKTLNSGDHVTSRFNAVYEDCLLMCADEAMWAGDKKGEGILKGLITAPDLWIEHKGYEGVRVKNFTRFILTTNSDWAAPASWDERRFFVRDIGDEWRNDYKKFRNMLIQMDNGGYAGMLHDLLKLKISADLRNPPKTEALKDQILYSESLYVQFWRELVEDTDPDVWPKEIKKEELTDRCQQYFAKVRTRQQFSVRHFFQDLHRYIQPWEIIKRVDIDKLSEGRKRYLVLPDHKTCLKLTANLN